jgi:hypothetical protein
LSVCSRILHARVCRAAVVRVVALDAVVPVRPAVRVVALDAVVVPLRQRVQPIPAACMALAAACVFPVA